MDRYEITKDDHQLIQKGLEVLEKNSALWKLPPDGMYDKVYLCYIDGNEAARHMYEKLGFKATGEEDEDEIVMVKELIQGDN